MPLQPLIFDTHEHAKHSLNCMRKIGIIKITKLNNLDGYRVGASNQLSEELLIAASGNTYLLSDILALTEEEAAKESVCMLSKLGGMRTLAQIRQQKTENLIHNKPLAKALASMVLYRSDYTVDIPDRTSIIFPFTPVFPVITDKEVTEEKFKADDFASFSARKHNLQPYKVLTPNKALEELYLHGRKTAAQCSEAKLAVIALIKDFPESDNYRAVIQQHPEIANKSYDELRQLDLENTKGIDALNKKIGKYERYIERHGVRVILMTAGASLLTVAFLLPIYAIVGSAILVAKARMNTAEALHADKIKRQEALRILIINSNHAPKRNRLVSRLDYLAGQSVSECVPLLQANPASIMQNSIFAATARNSTDSVNTEPVRTMKARR